MSARREETAPGGLSVYMFCRFPGLCDGRADWTGGRRQLGGVLKAMLCMMYVRMCLLGRLSRPRRDREAGGRSWAGKTDRSRLSTSRMKRRRLALCRDKWARAKLNTRRGRAPSLWMLVRVRVCQGVTGHE